MMKLHGFNDSDRKTSCQSFLMEFVSLMSYNGTMLYPQIKKSKEVNLNLPCTGYRSDMEAALSRIGECMRIGCNQSFLYFMQKLHGLCVADAYSILPDMRNNLNRDIRTLYNTPIELFGLSNTLPMFSLFCKGNVNNYRLFHYGDDINRRQLISLYLIGKKINELSEYSEENLDYSYSFYNPRYYYEYDSNVIFNIRNNLNITYEEITQFWKDHISYKLIKPKNCGDLSKWIKCMFYNRSFAEAYTKTSRTKMTMRISKFVSAKIIKEYFTYKDMKDSINSDFLDLRTAITKLYDDITKIVVPDDFLTTTEGCIFQKILSKSDPTINTIYSYFNNIMFLGYEKKRRAPVAMKMPRQIKTFYVQNNASTLIQYIFNRDDFIKDDRRVNSEASLEKDYKTLEKIYGETLTNKNPLNVMSIYNDMIINSEKNMVMIGYDRGTQMLIDSLMDVMSESNLPHIRCNWSYHGEIQIKHPFNQQETYIKFDRLTPDLNKQNIETLTLLFTYLKFKLNYSDRKIFDIFESLQFKDQNGYTDITGLLDRFNEDYIKDFDVDFTDHKIIAFMKQYVQYDTIISENLIQSAYMYTYFYEKKAQKIGGVWDGKTICSFTYMDKLFKLFHIGKEKPLLIAESSPGGYIIPAYNVALKLCDLLSEDELKYNPHENRLLKNLITYDNDIKEFCIKQRIYAVMEYNNNKIGRIQLKNLSDGAKIIPIFLTKSRIVKIIGQKYLIRRYKPEIKGINMISGRMKMFTLPFWRCRQYNTITTTKDIIIENIPLNNLLTDNLLYKYLHDKPFVYNDDIIPTENDLNSMEIFIKNQTFELNQIQKEILCGNEYLRILLNLNEQPKESVICDNMDDMLGLDLDEGFDDFLVESDLNVIGALDVDEFIVTDESSNKMEDFLLDTFGEINLGDLNLIEKREKYYRKDVNYTLNKIMMRPSLNCVMIMNKYKVNIPKKCDIFNYKHNLIRLTNLCNNITINKVYLLIGIYKALKFVELKSLNLSDKYYCDIQRGEISLYEKKYFDYNEAILSALTIKEKKYEIISEKIVVKQILTMEEFNSLYQENVGFKYHYFNIPLKFLTNTRKTMSIGDIDFNKIL